jgi:hypothetical protein
MTKTERRLTSEVKYIPDFEVGSGKEMYVTYRPLLQKATCSFSKVEQVVTTAEEAAEADVNNPPKVRSSIWS